MRLRWLKPSFILLCVVLMSACGSATPSPFPETNGVILQSGTPTEEEMAGPAGTLVLPLDPNGGGNYKLYLLHLDGSGPIRLTPTESEITGAETSPAWSPGGRHLVFVGYTDNGVDLFIINADDSGLRNLTNRPGLYRDPSFSPDGTRILLAHSTTDGQRIEVVELSSGEITVLTGTTAYDSAPIWSPRGDRIAYFRFAWGECKNTPPPTPIATTTGVTTSGLIACDADPITTLVTMNPDGSGAETVMTVSGFAEDSHWSPDGSTIALTTFGAQYTNEHVRLVQLDGSGPDRNVMAEITSSIPRWSPSGDKLSLLIVDPGGSEAALNVMDASGTDLRHLSELHGWHMWSADGTWIAVRQSRLSGRATPTGRSDLFVIDTGGQHQRRLLENAAIGTYPAWRPAGG